MNKVYVARLLDETMATADVLPALSWLGWEELAPEGARVFIKPNLTWPEPLPGVTTTPQAIEAVVAALRKRTPNIMVGESDGGYHSYQAEEAFRGHGLYELGEKYGAQIVNLSRGAAEQVTMEVAGRPVTVTLPTLLLHETDVFITMPVPKTHVMTGVSLAFKNQWGCIPSPMRLREHAEFDRKILAVNRALRTRLAIFDGTYFLDGAGPMTGDVVKMNLLIAGDGAGAASSVACRIMGIDPRTIRHLRMAQTEGLMPRSSAEVTLNTDLAPFIARQFRMKRAFLDWISLVGFRSRFFTNLFWDSWLARPLHEVLFAVRRNRLFNRVLYGKAGTPPSWEKPLPADQG